MLAHHKNAHAADEQVRIAKLLEPPISFIGNDQFELLEPEAVRCLPEGETLYRDEPQVSAADFELAGSLSYYQRLPLLSVAGERHLFRKMNYLRFRADRLRNSLDHECPDPQTLDELEAALQDADAAANHIAGCNLRLVISIARKFATNAQEFDELVSEGNMILLKAIEKFDFDRGFRFSTYATHSVQRHIYRWSRTRQRRRQKELAASSELLHSVPEGDHEDAPVDSTQAVDAMMHKIDECLDERERVVVHRRFGIGVGEKKRTLREIAAEIGLSKERVRQIQVAAIGKLQEAFGHVDLETFCQKATVRT